MQVQIYQKPRKDARVLPNICGKSGEIMCLCKLRETFRVSSRNAKLQVSENLMKALDKNFIELFSCNARRSSGLKQAKNIGERRTFPEWFIAIRWRSLKLNWFIRGSLSRAFVEINHRKPLRAFHPISNTLNTRSRHYSVNHRRSEGWINIQRHKNIKIKDKREDEGQNLNEESTWSERKRFR